MRLPVTKEHLLIGTGIIGAIGAVAFLWSRYGGGTPDAALAPDAVQYSIPTMAGAGFSTQPAGAGAIGLTPDANVGLVDPIALAKLSNERNYNNNASLVFTSLIDHMGAIGVGNLDYTFSVASGTTNIDFTSAFPWIGTAWDAGVGGTGNPSAGSYSPPPLPPSPAYVNPTPSQPLPVPAPPSGSYNYTTPVAGQNPYGAQYPLFEYLTAPQPGTGPNAVAYGPPGVSVPGLAYQPSPGSVDFLNYVVGGSSGA